MKKNLKNSMLVALLSIVTLAFARANDVSLAVHADDQRTIDLILENSQEELSVSFMDIKGEILYSADNLDFVANKKSFDFKELPVGNYFFVIESETKIEKLPLTLTSGKTIVDTEKEEVVYKPYFRVDNNIISMNMLSIDETPVDVKIYDNSDIMLYNTILSGDKSLGQRFDFSKAKPGVYRIVVKHDGKTFYKSIKL